MTNNTQSTEREQFLKFLDTWIRDLPTGDLQGALQPPENTAIVSVDLLKGFCHIGALSSPRVKGILPAVTSLMTRAWGLGLQNFILTQDTHEPDALEFCSWPPHCIRGTEESETTPELAELSFSDLFVILEKNSTSSVFGTGFDDWLADHPTVDTFILVGDCTDLCIYQMAMALRLSANAHQVSRRIIIPADCVQTYHFSVEAAAEFGGFPHDGDLMHDIFLYHMALNGIEVYRSLG